MKTFEVDRRTFLCAGLGATLGTGNQGPRLETLTDWLSASRETRELGLQTCLDRIKDMDPSVHAWVQVQPERPTGSGKLSGIPFGAKDIIETKGLATEYGSPIYKGRIGTADAAVIRDMRQRGAILLGKTHTTAFAYRTPAPTRNPRDLEHTPGGSSSGSAAAVAAGMVPLAVGEQTLGSVLRPASYCGVTGFKVSYGLLSMEGVLPLAKSLDTLGFYTHTPEDMLAFWECLGRSAGAEEELALAAPEPVPDVEPAMAAAFANALSVMRKAGASIRPIDISAMLARLADAAKTVMFYEGARFHQERFRQYGSRLADLADLVREGLQISLERYDEARRYIAECRGRVAEIYKATPVIVVPAATGPAPLGLAFTGDTSMNAPWTALGTPAISLPMPVQSGLPLGLQLTADHGQDARVIRTAVRVQRMLASALLLCLLPLGAGAGADESTPLPRVVVLATGGTIASRHDSAKGVLRSLGQGMLSCERRSRVPTATMTSKGQITIPKDVRERLGLEAGDRVVFVVHSDRDVSLKPAKIDVRELHGMLYRKALPAARSVDVLREE